VNKQKRSYEIIAHYPKTKEGEIELRKELGKAYIIFVKEYVMDLQISDEQKNKLYNRIIEKL